jgi:hypothetical protein
MDLLSCLNSKGRLKVTTIFEMIHLFDPNEGYEKLLVQFRSPASLSRCRGYGRKEHNATTI